MIVNGGQPVSFNYGTFDQAAGLYVGGAVYDVTSGTPTLVGSIISMADYNEGIYYGSFTPNAGHSYLVICSVFVDAGFTTPNTSRPPIAYQYDAFTASTALLNFNYGAYDQASNLTVNATIFNITSSTAAALTMTYVAYGIYFGQYQGTVGNSYLVVKAPTDTTRNPGSDSLQAFTLSGGTTANIYLTSPTLVVVGQSLNGVLGGGSSMQVSFTQGDNVTLNLTATDGNGNPINLTGASIVTLIRGANGAPTTTIPNGQHTILNQTTNLGQYQVSLMSTDSLSCGLGSNKEIISVVTIGGATVSYHGVGILTVNPPVPQQ